MDSPQPTSRRGAIGKLVGVTIAWTGAASAFLASCSSALGRLGGHRRTAVGKMESLPPGGGLRASLGGDDSVVVVNVDGAVRAYLAVCTHEGCPLGWNAQQHLIRCPCHGGAYDTNGHVVAGPPPAPLTELRAVVDRGTIYIIR